MIPVLLVMVLYGVSHSWLAGSQVKAAFRARFGDRAYHGFYRLIFNLVAALALLPTSILFAVYPDGVVWVVDPGLLPLLMGVQAVGLVGVVISLLQIDLWQFAGVRQVWAYLRGEPLPLPTEPLQTRGLYALVRHPLYLFSMLAILPVPVMTGAYLGFCLGAVGYFTIGSIYEERRLAATFGADYEAYRQRVPWLLPLPRPRASVG